jgi:hypothetical protein
MVWIRARILSLIIRAVEWIKKSASAAGFAEALSIVGFTLGDLAKQVTVGLGTESFRTVAIIMEKASGEGARRVLAVFDFQTVECGQGNAVSAIETAKGFKDFGFELAVRAWCRLRRWIGAGSFIGSHIYLPPAGGVVRARSVSKAPDVARWVSAISNWQIAISQIGCGYFFFLGLRGTGDLACAFCFARSFWYRVFLPLAILGRSWRRFSTSASVQT